MVATTGRWSEAVRAASLRWACTSPSIAAGLAQIRSKASKGNRAGKLSGVGTAPIILASGRSRQHAVNHSLKSPSRIQTRSLRCFRTAPCSTPASVAGSRPSRCRRTSVLRSQPMITTERVARSIASATAAKYASPSTRNETRSAFTRRQQLLPSTSRLALAPSLDTWDAHLSSLPLARPRGIVPRGSGHVVSRCGVLLACDRLVAQPWSCRESRLPRAPSPPGFSGRVRFAQRGLAWVTLAGAATGGRGGCSRRTRSEAGTCTVGAQT